MVSCRAGGVAFEAEGRGINYKNFGLYPRIPRLTPANDTTHLATMYGGVKKECKETSFWVKIGCEEQGIFVGRSIFLFIP